MKHLSNPGLTAIALFVTTACTAKSATAPTHTPTPLSLTCPGAQTAASTDGSPVAVTFAVPAATGGTQPVTTTCTPSSGSQFNVGSSSVTCQSSDAARQSASCTFAVTVGGPPRLQFTRFLAFGDSITQGGTSDPVSRFTSALTLWSPDRIRTEAFAAEPYPLGVERRLAPRYPQQSIQVVNAGVTGELAYEGGIARFFNVIRNNQPEVVLLMEGTNDISTPSGVDPGIAALDRMIQQAEGLGARVLLATIPPQRPDGVRHRADIAGRVFVFNDRVRGLAAAHNLVLVDVNSALSGSLNVTIGVDDEHPTQQGYNVISDTFVTAISDKLEQSSAAVVSSRHR